MTIFRFSLLVAAVMPGFALAGDDAAVTLPSGLSATLFETRWEPQANPAEMWVRFRFLTPEIEKAALEFNVVGEDLAFLCRSVALPAIAADGRKADQAVISLSSEAIALGEADPDITQYFEAYRVADHDCILEVF